MPRSDTARRNPEVKRESQQRKAQENPGQYRLHPEKNPKAHQHRRERDHRLERIHQRPSQVAPRTRVDLLQLLPRVLTPTRGVHVPELPNVVLRHET